ncbi:zinc ribbon domain-containing protein [Clostridium sp. 'deep sea']|uniref:zinc ribbon domain-containing protein n=1 Tax=Clostridium sp. 'deep sea' TaxID=2779445 RepID=UPI0018966949|nr:zinc ribbon domain-containing protein [Clostridium sp. 'deep sea']QOR33704.1 zinc ribbon domain-containing protein [Clostridium sp. 'deep sea']
MDFLRNVTKDIGKMSGQLVETTKLSAKINSEENKIRKIYTELGEQMYKDFQHGESFKEPYMVMFSDISIIKSNIAQLRKELLDVKGVVLCKNCGQEVKRDVTFCAKCGSRMDETEVKHNINQKNCHQCGAVVAEDSKYCPECGILIKD